MTLDVDDRLRLGEFGIQTRLVKPPARDGAEPVEGRPGETMVYTAAAPQKRSRAPKAARGLIETKAVVVLDDRRYVLEGPKASVGRSRECDCVLHDDNVSRKHAELRRLPSGDWQVVDLGSTNGIKVNDRKVESTRLSPGDRVTLGTTEFVFEIER